MSPKAVLPEFDITSSDIHLEANDFITTLLGGRAIPSASVPECFDAAGEIRYRLRTVVLFPHA